MARRDGKREGKRAGPSTSLRAGKVGGRQVNKTLARLSPGFRVPVSAGQVPVKVTSVTALTGGGGGRRLEWEFSVPVSAVEAGGGQKLRVSADGVSFESPASVAVQGGVVAATYPAGGPVLAAGSVFEVTAPPTGVTFSGVTAGVALPQAGQVVAEEGGGEGRKGRRDGGTKGKTPKARAAFRRGGGEGARRVTSPKLRLAA